MRPAELECNSGSAIPPSVRPCVRDHSLAHTGRNSLHSTKPRSGLFILTTQLFIKISIIEVIFVIIQNIWAHNYFLHKLILCKKLWHNIWDFHCSVQHSHFIFTYLCCGTMCFHLVIIYFYCMIKNIHCVITKLSGFIHHSYEVCPANAWIWIL